MKHILIAFLLLQTIVNNITSKEPAIHVLATAALLPIRFEERKGEYYQALTTVKNFGYTPYIVEACQPNSQPTFLDELGTVIYTGTNDPALKNKGINEAQSIIAALSSLPFDDEDIVLKLTGRYFFKSDSFIRFIENNKHFDAFARKDPIGILSGCFAMKYKHLKKMLLEIDYAKMETEFVAIETKVAQFLHRMEMEGCKVHYADTLDLYVHFFFDGIHDWVDHK